MKIDSKNTSNRSKPKIKQSRKNSSKCSDGDFHTKEVVLMDEEDLQENPYEDGKIHKKLSKNSSEKSIRAIKEGELMRQSAAQIPSALSQRRDSEIKRQNSKQLGSQNSVNGADSIMSLFAQLPEVSKS